MRPKPPKAKAPTPDWIKERQARQSDRIDLQDTPAAAVFKLVQGDRAAAEACIAMIKAVAAADPSAEFGPFTPLLILQANGLVGAAIGDIYRHACGGDPVAALAVLHALRLKLISVTTLRNAAARRARLDVAKLLDLIRQKIPDFGRGFPGTA